MKKWAKIAAEPSIVRKKKSEMKTIFRRCGSPRKREEEGEKLAGFNFWEFNLLFLNDSSFFLPTSGVFDACTRAYTVSNFPGSDLESKSVSSLHAWGSYWSVNRSTIPWRRIMQLWIIVFFKMGRRRVIKFAFLKNVCWSLASCIFLLAIRNICSAKLI